MRAKRKTDPAKPKDDIEIMRERYKLGRDHCREAYAEAASDIKFVAVPGHQYDENLKRRRKNRPMYEFPKLATHIRQVVNEQKQTRPAGKVRGVGAEDKGLAEIMQGLCRNIESVSNADQVYDIAYLPAVQGGFGVWRICADYESDDSFDQSLWIDPIGNPFSVTFDPSAVKLDRRDGNFAFVEEMKPLETFEMEYPKADTTDFDLDENLKDWKDAGQIKVAEYWEKVPCKRDLLALSDGSIVYADTLEKSHGIVPKLDGKQKDLQDINDELKAIGLQIVKSRIVNSHKVQMRLTNGREFLGETYEFKSKFIPLIPCWGNIQNIDGVDYWCGMVRTNKDQQRLHNVHRSAVVEAVAKAPKAPFIARPKAIAGFESMWSQANSEDYPVLLIADNTPTGEEPVRSQAAQIPAALIQLAAMDNDDIKASTGQFDASLGQRSNETSGVAINSRKMQGAVATYNYIDGLQYAIRFSYEILVDAIPNYYDTPRVVRILGEDGGEKWKQLYQEVTDPKTGQKHTVNDISKGKYDVVVTIGPAFATQRMEAVEAFTQLAGQIGRDDPILGPLLAYQVVKNLDIPGSEEVSAALRGELIAKGILQPGPNDPPPKPAQPNPMLVAKVNEIGAKVGKIHAETDRINHEAGLMSDETRAEIRQMLSVAILNEMKAMGQAGDVDAMVRYNAAQFGPGGDGTDTPHNPHFIPPPDPADAPVTPQGAPQQGSGGAAASMQ